MELPKDPRILFSIVNTKLRDMYDSLDALCEEEGMDKEWVINSLRELGFEYDKSRNKFW